MLDKQVLIIDGMKHDREQISRQFREAGYLPLTASSGEEGLELATTYHPDVIILDTVLVGLNGFEVCDRLKRKTSTRSIPVVMFTASRQVLDIMRSVEVGADAFFPKSAGPDKLLRRVEMLLAGARSDQFECPLSPDLLEPATALFIAPDPQPARAER